MNLEEVIATRRSVRRFSDAPVDEAILKKIINAGRWAPSHCNTQGWKFIIVTDKKVQQKIVDNGGNAVISQAPAGILIIYEQTSENLEYQDWIQSGAAAIQNMLLTAHSLDIGACWICHLPRKRDLKRIMAIGGNYSPVAYVILGHPLKPAAEMPRKENLDEMISYNRFAPAWSGKNIRPASPAKKILKKIYFYLPASIKKIVNPLVDKNFVKKFDN